MLIFAAFLKYDNCFHAVFIALASADREVTRWLFYCDNQKVKHTENQRIASKIMPDKFGYLQKNDYLYTIFKKPFY